MPLTELVYRLRVRTGADDADLLVVTSLPEGYAPPGEQPGAFPYIARVPQVDGASLDPLSGKVTLGEGTVRVIDALQAEPPTPIATETFDEYIPGDFTGGEDGAATSMFRTGRWSRHGVTALTGAVSYGTTYSGLRNYASAFMPSELVTGDAYVQRSEWGLPPDTDVAVRVRWYPSGFLGWDSSVANNYPKVGLEVEGATAPQRHASRGFDDPPPEPVRWFLLRATGRTRSDGTLDIRLGHFDFVSTSGNRGAIFDQIEIYRLDEGGEGGDRIVTRELADEDGEWQLLGRRAYIEEAPRSACTFDEEAGLWEFPAPGSASIRVLQAGYCTRVKLVSPLVYEIGVGDTERDDRDRRVFAEVSDTFPNASCLIGGPIRQPWPGGGAPSLGESGGYWTMEVVEDFAEGLRLDITYIAIPLDYRNTKADEWEGLGATFRDRLNAAKTRSLANTGARPFWVPFADSDALASLRASHKIDGYFPRLVAEVRSTVDILLGEVTPLAIPRRLEATTILPTPEFRAVSDEITYKGKSFYVLWPESAGARPTVGTEVRVRVFPRDVSAKFPLHVAGHVVDIATAYFTTQGIAYDAASAAAVKAAVPWARVAWRVTEPPTLDEFKAKWLGGPFGIALVPDGDGGMKFVTTHLSTPGTWVIETDDLRSAEPVAFDHDESGVVSGVTYDFQRFARWTEDDGDRPFDGIIAAPTRVLGTRATPPTGATPYPYGTREQVYTVPGLVLDADGHVADAVDFANTESVPIVEAYGRGPAMTELDVFRATDAPLGSVGVVEAAHVPGRIAGSLPVSARGYQVRARVVRTDPVPAGYRLKVLAIGASSAAAPGTVTPPETPEVPTPTLDLEPDATAPTTTVVVTLTNAADLLDVGLDAAVEYAVQADAPTGAGTHAGIIDTADTDTLTLPAVTPGARVWVRAIPVDAALVEIDSAASAWQSIDLAEDPTAAEDVIADFGSGYETVAADFGSGNENVQATF